LTKRPFLAAASLTIALAAPAAAQQRPLLTEDPETIGSGLVLIEGGFDYARDILFPVSGLQGNLLKAPTLGVSFGLSSIAELQIDGGLYNRLEVTSRRDAPSPHPRARTRTTQRRQIERRSYSSCGYFTAL
jgi:hypothetical protein